MDGYLRLMQRQDLHTQPVSTTYFCTDINVLIGGHQFALCVMRLGCRAGIIIKIEEKKMANFSVCMQFFHILAQQQPSATNSRPELCISCCVHCRVLHLHTKRYRYPFPPELIIKLQFLKNHGASLGRSLAKFRSMKFQSFEVWIRLVLIFLYSCGTEYLFVTQDTFLI